MADGWYVDGGYTFISLEEGAVDVDLGSLTARGGYDFNQNFGAEIEAATGVTDESILGATVELDYLVGAYGKVQYPVSETVNLFARAGIVSAELDVSGGGLGLSSSETGAGYGVGGTVDISPNLYARGDYTRYDLDNLEADAFHWATSSRLNRHI